MFVKDVNSAAGMKTRMPRRCYVSRMTRWKRQPTLMLVALVLLALLPLLAALQYHWVGQLTENERDRMRNNLTAGVERFSEDFDRELTRIYSTFQQAEPLDPNSKVAAEIIASDFELAENMTRWSRTPRAELLKDLYVVEDLFANSGPRIRRFDPDRKVLDTVLWPEELLHLKSRILQHTDATQLGAGPGEFTAPLVLFHDPPLVVIPRLTAFDFEAAKAELWEKMAARKIGKPGSVVVAVLDRAYVEKFFIPDLMRKYFADGDEIEYNIAIASKKDPQKFLYVSDSAMPGDAFAAPDAAVDIFGLRMDSLIFVHNKALITETFHAKVHEQVVEGGTASGRISLVLNKQGAPKTPAADFKIAHTPLESEWQLVVKHRSGSLETAVGNARLRNLGISFGILMVLGISVLTMLISTHRAQRLARQQMAFVAGVSHELRTPLAVIRSAGENLADGLIDDPSQGRKYGTIIRNEGRRLSEMVERILDFAGIQAQRRNYELRPVEVTDLVKATLDENTALLESGMFEVATALPLESMKILGDPAALKSALQNLISNAVKYSNGSKWIGLTIQRHGNSVEIRVQDRGIGIPSSDLPHIFEPFYRGREVMDAQIQGSGLGLSLVKHVVEGHKGTIAVDSSHRRGTTFTLKLPAMCV